MIVARAWSSKKSVCEVSMLEEIPSSIEDKMSRYLVSSKQEPVDFVFHKIKYILQKSKFPGQPRHYIVDLIKLTRSPTTDEMDEAFSSLIRESKRQIESTLNDDSQPALRNAAAYLFTTMESYDPELYGYYLSRLPSVFAGGEHRHAVEAVQEIFMNIGDPTNHEETP